MRARTIVALSVLSGCSFSFGGGSIDGKAVELIEGRLSDDIGLGELKGSCDEPPDDPRDGDEFDCTGETADGDVVRFVATVDGDDRVELNTTNLITERGLNRIEDAAVALLEEEVGQTLGLENFDCGEAPLLFDADEEVLVCELTDPVNGDLYDAEVDLSGLGEDDEVTSVVVADEPKG
jgi:hypothetical protein